MEINFKDYLPDEAIKSKKEEIKKKISIITDSLDHDVLKEILILRDEAGYLSDKNLWRNKMTDKQVALDEVEFSLRRLSQGICDLYEAGRDDCHEYHDYALVLKTIRQALTAPQVDVEGLKQAIKKRLELTLDINGSGLAEAIVEIIEERGLIGNAQERGKEYTIEHDGFKGTVIGQYKTREGKEGVVLQQVGTRVVHVYGRKWLKEERGE